MCLGARFAAGNLGYQFVAVLDGFAVNRHNGVSDLESALVGRAAGDDVCDGDARIDAINARDSRILLLVELDANGAARHAVLGSDQLVVHLHHRVGRQGKSHARVGIGFGKDGGVDANDFPAHVDQRAAELPGLIAASV